MDTHGRRLLRRIALGLPLLTLGCTETTGGGRCPDPIAVREHDVTSAQLDGILSGARDYVSECDTVCREFDVYGVPPEAGIDAGALADGGRYLSNTRATCTQADAGTPRIVCTYTPICIGGRAPAGFAPASGLANDVAGWLARAAHLERASVRAFEELAAELALHGAPRRLTREALRAADDERRHAQTVEALVVHRGARVPDVRRSPSSRRSLSALAIDNAIEGCVREAYGALVAAHQAEHAEDADVRVAYREIAVDEARHALLSLAIHDWARAQLSIEAAKDLDERRQAELAMWRALPLEDAATRKALGLPDGAMRTALLDALA